MFKKFFQYIHKGDLLNLDKLISKDLDIKGILLKPSQDSALHIAIRRGNIYILEFLLDNGFNIFLEHQNSDGKRPLHEAVQAPVRSRDMVELLLKKGVEIDSLKRADWTPLMLATAKGNLDVIQLLVNCGASLDLCNKDGWTSFHIACRNKDEKIVEYFLALKEDIWNTRSHNGRTPLHTAALHGNFEIIKLLLEKEYDSDADCCGNIPLMDAVRSSHLDSVDILLSWKPNALEKMDNMGRLSIHLAAEAGQVNILLWLINQIKINVDALSSSGQTPLQFAAKENQLETIRTLIGHGASINHRDHVERTALWMALSSRNMEAVQLLKLLGAEDATIEHNES